MIQDLLTAEYFRQKKIIDPFFGVFHFQVWAMDRCFAQYWCSHTTAH